MNKNYDYKFLSIKEQVNHLKNNDVYIIAYFIFYG